MLKISDGVSASRANIESDGSSILPIGSLPVSSITNLGFSVPEEVRILLKALVKADPSSTAVATDLPSAVFSTDDSSVSTEFLSFSTGALVLVVVPAPEELLPLFVSPGLLPPVLPPWDESPATTSN
ncbi:hypothetical protein D3C78_1612330 [compost metagenome]